MWSCLYQVVPLDNRAAIAEEAERQLEMFRALTGREPTHLDSHQHVHLHEPVKSVLIDLAERLTVPLRHFSRHVKYCGEFYGQTGKGHPCLEAITVDRLFEIISTLPLGVTELACHGHQGPSGPDGAMYGRERALEIATLCDSRVRDALLVHEVELCSFENLRNRPTPAGGPP
jgi:predicted glycoside hydrolase/deacetylase ChbG (UPF0249 family)